MLTHEMKFKVLVDNEFWVTRSMILDSIGKDLWRVYARNFDMMIIMV